MEIHFDVKVVSRITIIGVGRILAALSAIIPMVLDSEMLTATTPRLVPVAVEAAAVEEMEFDWVNNALVMESLVAVVVGEHYLAVAA